jgi:hypothetical protein
MDTLSMRVRPGLVAFAWAMATFVVPVTAAEFHVSGAGNDTHPGSADKPFRTITAARDAAYSVLLHEATAQARLFGLVPAASGALRLVAGHRERVMDVWLRQAASARDRR